MEKFIFHMVVCPNLMSKVHFGTRDKEIAKKRKNIEINSLNSCSTFIIMLRLCKLVPAN